MHFEILHVRKTCYNCHSVGMLVWALLMQDVNDEQHAGTLCRAFWCHSMRVTGRIETVCTECRKFSWEQGTSLLSIAASVLNTDIDYVTKAWWIPWNVHFPWRSITIASQYPVTPQTHLLCTFPASMSPVLPFFWLNIHVLLPLKGSPLLGWMYMYFWLAKIRNIISNI